MATGSRIFHQEMPKPMINVFNYPFDPNTVSGLQLWVDLPANMKVTDPVYRGVRGIPKEEFDFGTVQVLAGNYEGLEGR